MGPHQSRKWGRRLGCGGKGDFSMGVLFLAADVGEVQAGDGHWEQSSCNWRCEPRPRVWRGQSGVPGE